VGRAVNRRLPTIRFEGWIEGIVSARSSTYVFNP
jgi:hypothetical protein